MSNDSSALLKNYIRQMIDEALPLRQLSVSAIGAEANTVDLRFGDGVIESVPCAASYGTRKVGDKVWVAKSPAGNFEVLCKSEADAAQAAVSQADLQAVIDDAMPDWTLNWGTTAPGAGWLQCTTLYMQDGGVGKRNLYAVLTAPAPPGSVKP